MFGIKYQVLEPMKSALAIGVLSLIGLLFLSIVISFSSYKYIAVFIIVYLLTCFVGTLIFYQKAERGEVRYIKDPLVDYAIILYCLYLVPCALFFYLLIHFDFSEVSTSFYNAIGHWPILYWPIWSGEPLRHVIILGDERYLPFLFLKTAVLVFLPFALFFSLFFSSAFKRLFVKNRDALTWLIFGVSFLVMALGVCISTEQIINSSVTHRVFPRVLRQNVDGMVLGWIVCLPLIGMGMISAIIGAMRAWHNEYTKKED